MPEPSERPENWMWRSQKAFRQSAKDVFVEILRELNCPLWHDISLVGFQTDAPAGITIVRIEPEWDGFPLDELKEAFDDLKGIFTPYPEDDDQSDDEWWAALRKHDEYCLELKRAIARALNEGFDTEKCLVFVSPPYQIKNHLVSIVMIVERKGYEAQPHLSEAVSLHGHGQRPSFLYAVIEGFLESLAEEMTKPENGSLTYGTYAVRDVKELLRSAGARFMHTAARPGTGVGVVEIIKHGMYDFFKACNVISSMHYEGGESTGHLIVSERGHPAITVRMEFTQPVDPNDYRKIRKLLEMCESDKWLLFAKGGVYGLGFALDGAYDPKREDLFVVKFVKHHCWEVVHDNQVLMRTTYNEPRLPQPNLDEADLKEKLTEFVPGVGNARATHLVRLAKLVSEANTGTMLVITPDAAAEAKRLADQCFTVRPFSLSAEQLPSVLEIDGAVLLDERGNCHAIGAILDGRATPLGTSARGSRYNSAVRYVQEHPQAVALVVSEDGMVNVVTFVDPERRDVESLRRREERPAREKK